MKLCYKEYTYKMSLGAMKQFKQATGKDLWCTLLQFMECYALSNEDATLVRIRKLYEVLDFETAAQLFHALIRAGNKSIPIEEIEDGMFKVGWLPSERADNMSEPWPLVLVLLSHEINKQFTADASELKK